MKKSTLIIIALVYVASIVIISLFGMRAYVYTEVIPVAHIECLNSTDAKSEVYYSGDMKVIKVKFTTPGNRETLTGTMLQLSYRVTPDNATNKEVKFVYTENKRAEFVKDENGRDLGLILFTGEVVLKIKIVATDGSKVYTELVVWVY